MTTKHKSSNPLELILTLILPTLALAACLLAYGADLGSVRAWFAAAVLGLLSSTAHFFATRAFRQSKWKDEILLQTGIRAALSICLAFLVGTAFFG